ncbi:MAG: FHA domain-containing protein [Bdellovibrionales bacterium]|nr:FHA domain-containing protein [Bdellovibrionales bacterium]
MATLKAFLHGKEIASIQLRSGEEYIVGRAEGCAIQLQEQPGISRQHFKVAGHDGIWKASVLSKFGEIIVAGEAISEVELTPTSVFNVATYDFRIVEEASAVSAAVPTSRSAAVGAENFSEDAPPPPATPGGTLSLVPVPPQHQQHSFEGNDDATNVGVSLPGRPSIRIVKSSGSEQRIDLDGKKWLAGREDTCDIFLPDRKASRRQFEITSTPEGYFVTDLGSANGTVLNGTPLVPEEPHLLQSGDVLSVNALKVHFEVRDPNFEKRLVAISPNVLAAPLAPVAQYEMINYPVLQGPGGAVRIDNYGAEWAADNDKKNSKAKTIRLAAILAIVIIGLYAAFGTDSDSKGGKANDQETASIGFRPSKNKRLKRSTSQPGISTCRASLRMLTNNSKNSTRSCPKVTKDQRRWRKTASLSAPMLRSWRLLRLNKSVSKSRSVSSTATSNSVIPSPIEHSVWMKFASVCRPPSDSIRPIPWLST